MLNTLIAEGNAAYRRSLHQLLAGHFPSMQIAEAADGEETLRQMGARHFDLIFMDVSLPQGHEFILTQAIRTLLADSLICTITGHEMAEHRNVALRYGADHFMVKGESTEAEIVAWVESLLRPRFITLIIDSDTPSRKQLKLLLTVRWPDMSVAEALDAAAGFDRAKSLEPDLVLLELGQQGTNDADVARRIRRTDPKATLVGMADDRLPACRSTAIRHGVDYCVPLTPEGHTDLTIIVNSLQPRRIHR